MSEMSPSSDWLRTSTVEHLSRLVYALAAADFAIVLTIATIPESSRSNDVLLAFRCAGASMPAALLSGVLLSAIGRHGMHATDIMGPTRVSRVYIGYLIIAPVVLSTGAIACLIKAVDTTAIVWFGVTGASIVSLMAFVYLRVRTLERRSEPDR